MVAVLLDRPLGQLRLLAERALREAAKAPFQVHVDALPRDERRAPLLASLQLLAPTLRRRTPAMWEALDALDSVGGNAERAAHLLGCSGQAVRERRARANAAATTHLVELLAAVLAPTEGDRGQQGTVKVVEPARTTGTLHRHAA